MKALQILYLLVWFYAVYYACYMLYKLLGADAIPLYICAAILFVIKWIVNIVRLRE